MRKTPEDGSYMLFEIGRLAKGRAMGRPVYGLCPAGCGCIWRDNFDGSMSLGINQESCESCETKGFDDLIPLYAAPSASLEKQHQNCIAAGYTEVKP